MADLPIPEFYDRDVNEIVADMKAFYEALPGAKIIKPADPEMLLINMCAYREFVLRNANNDACLQMLLRFSRYPMLDYLAELFNVVRLAATGATTTLQFEIIPGHGALIIPQLTRVSTSDGSVTFETNEDIIVTIGTDTYTVIATSTLGGAAGNGFTPGNVDVLIDTAPSVVSVENIDVTSGGSDEETDDQLRERVRLAPNTFSVAGPTDAYKFFAFTAHPTIIDVTVTNPVPGTVQIFPLSTAGVPTPAPILAAVYDICNGEKVRPTCDTVLVTSPTAVPYNIEVEVVLYNSANQQLVQDGGYSALQQYSQDQGKKLGRDIIRAQISALCALEGVYNINVIQPAADVVLSPSQFGQIGTVQFTIVGFNNG